MKWDGVRGSPECRTGHTSLGGRAEGFAFSLSEMGNQCRILKQRNVTINLVFLLP